MTKPMTIADLRRHFGQPSHIINFAIERHGPQPSGRVGISRVWQESDLPLIKEALAKTAKRSSNAERRAASEPVAQ